MKEIFITILNSENRTLIRACRTLAALLSLAFIFPLLSCSPAPSTPIPTPLPASQTTRLTFDSTAMDATVPFIVYLPSGYTPAQKYPVWYAMHGYSSTEKWWLNDAHVGERADALTESGDLTPMIMVFPMTRYDDAKTIEADMADGVCGPSRMERFLCDELVPYIDAHYSTVAAP